VTTVINVPKSLDDHRQVEQLLEQVAEVPADAKLLVDARHTTFASPYGLTMLLTLAQTRLERPGFYPPVSEETGSYWARSHFYKFAEELYEFHGRAHPVRASGDSSVLLEVTPVTQSEDVHNAVERIQEKSQQILTEELHLEAAATMRFTMALSEACQNIVEHAGRGGWVAVQRYQWKARLGGRKVVVMGVCDAGMGIRASLESSPVRRITDTWDDRVALEEAVLNGLSRHKDPGRGQGFKGIRRFLDKWDGKMGVRSGSARLVSPMPEWYPTSDEPTLEEDLTEFPGTQLQILIPERIT
jgi:anti-sigma regulatory factor (Ser/Thr protein kinase)